MDRRAFLINAGLVSAWAGVSVVLHGCSDDDDPVTPPLGTGDVAGVIGSNHGHSVAITAAVIGAGDAVTLILSQGNGHTHSVALSAVQVGEIGTGSQVTATSSSDDGHTHSVSFN
jgi:hypothetical protein